MTVLGHATVALVCLLLPLGVASTARRNRLLLQSWLALPLSAFIWLSGLSHGLAILALWHPAPWWQAAELNLAGVVAVFCLVLLPSAKLRNTLTLEWWHRARRLKHDQLNLRHQIEGLCVLRGTEPPTWPPDEALPDAPREF